MKLRTILTMLVALCLAIASGGEVRAASPAPADTLTAADVFARIPLDVLDLLRPSTRLDMLDYYQHADSLLAAPDALGGKSRLAEVADDYLRLEVTPVSVLEIKILPTRKGSLVMTLYTVGGNDVAADTDVRFFDLQLNPLDASRYLKTPDTMRFFNLKNSGVKESDVREWLPFASVRYSAASGLDKLKAELTSVETLPQETRDKLRPLLVPSLSASWKGNSFKF